MIVAVPFFTSLRQVLDAANVKTQVTGYYNGDPPEDARVRRPYLLVRSVSEAPETWTNASQYGLFVFEAEVVHDVYEKGAGEVMPAVIKAVKDGTFTLAGAAVRGFRQGPSRYMQEKNFWRITVEFFVRVGCAK